MSWGVLACESLYFIGMNVFGRSGLWQPVLYWHECLEILACGSLYFIGMNVFGSFGLWEPTCMHCVYLGAVNMQGFVWKFLCAIHINVHSFIYSLNWSKKTASKQTSIRYKMKKKKKIHFSVSCYYLETEINKNEINIFNYYWYKIQYNFINPFCKQHGLP